MKKIKHLIIISILYSCTPNVNTTVLYNNKTSENKVIQSVKPYIMPSTVPNQIDVEVTDIFVFPENLILGIGEEKELYIKIKNSDGKYTDDFIIISSNNSIISVKDNKIKGLSEGKSQITISSKNDISKTKLINVEVMNDISINEIAKPFNASNIPYVYSDDYNNKFIVDYRKESNEKELYSFDNSLGYKKLEKTEIKYSFRPKTSNLRVIDIYHNNELKNTIDTNDLPYNLKKELLSIKNFKNFFMSILKDLNDNFIIVYTNSLKECRLKIFDKNGTQISKTAVISDSDNTFYLGVSQSGKKIIFSQKIYNNNGSYLKVKVFDGNLRNIFEKDFKNSITPNSSVFEDIYEGIANINDLGELVVVWEKKDYRANSSNNNFIHIEKTNLNNTKSTSYDLNIQNDSSIAFRDVFINNNSDINIFWFEDYGNKSLFTRYIPSDKHKDFTYLKVNQHYKLDTKYNKCVSSNEDVITIKPQESLFYSNQVGISTVTCFDENDYSKNNVIKINVGF